MPKGKCIFAINTVRNSSCGKVMFSQVSVCPQGGGKVYTALAGRPLLEVRHPLGRHPLAGRHPPGWQTPPGQADTPLQQTATAADGTHPTGMHSCLSILISGNTMKATNLAVIILHLIILFMGSLIHTFCLITHLCVK